MELKDLKAAWDKYSSQEVDKHRMGKEGIHELLKKRTQTMVERIDRNTRIGMGVLGLYVAYLVLDYLFLADYFAQMIMHRSVEYPKWLEPIDVFSTALIITTYVFFVLRYFKTKRSFSLQLQLKPLLLGIQETLITYRRMFYMAITILFINFLISYTAGIYKGLQLQATAAGVTEISMTLKQVLIIGGFSLIIIVPVILLSFVLLRWGFNKLYGQYLSKLNDTLQELEETDDNVS
jgi:hypothetical protein